MKNSMLSPRHKVLLACMLIISSVFSFRAEAEGKVFDPLLNPACKIKPSADAETWNSSYMWYPGQLSAHLQRVQKEKSVERCVNVGYPGVFFKDEQSVYFRKEIKLTEEVEIAWNTSGTVIFSINGKKQDADLREYRLSPGRYVLEFDVKTDNMLPAIIVKGKNVEDVKGWAVSLDEKNWCIPETDARYNKPFINPDEDQDIIVTISPDKYILLRNAENKKGKISLGKNGGLVIDFYHLEVGNVIVQASGSCNLNFSVGESPEEVLNDNAGDFEQRAINSFVLTEDENTIVLPERALRYLKITTDRPCTITSVQLEAKMWPVDFKMRFECDNQSINDLFNAGVATLHTSMHNFYLDGVKRDYLPWAMDAIVSSLGGDYVFGDQQVTRNGISVSLMPPNPSVTDWGIVDYPLHALIGIKQDYMRYGNIQTSLMFKDRILQQLSLYESVQDENGFLRAEPPTTGFIPGWSRKMGPDDYGIATYGQMLLYQNFVTGAYLARLWNDNALAKHYEKKAEYLGKSIKIHFWDDEKKAFINGYRFDGKKDDRISHHAQYWGVITNLYPEEHYDYLYDSIIPDIPFYKEYISFEKGYESLAYIKAGRTNDLFKLLNEVWGDWLRQGNTRFPENFSLGASISEQLAFYERPFGLSLCHGANGVPPIVAVLHGIWGFSVSEKNISEYTFRPDLLDLKWTRGRIPVKEGFINIDLNKQGTCSVEIPENCVVRLYFDVNAKPLILKKGGTYTFELKN